MPCLNPACRTLQQRPAVKSLAVKRLAAQGKNAGGQQGQVVRSQGKHAGEGAAANGGSRMPRRRKKGAEDGDPRSRPWAHLDLRVGHCGQTDFGGDCARGDMGAWRGVRSVKECITRCQGCARCEYISFSDRLTTRTAEPLARQHSSLLSPPDSTPGLSSHTPTVRCS